MNGQTLSYFIERDLLKLKDEIALYKNENDLWVLKGEISNSTGNLCLHLIGNLNHFIGSTLGHTGYVRNREVEFSDKNIPREQLLKRLDETIEVVKTCLSPLTVEDFDKEFALKMQERTVTTGQMLLHIATHLSYHLGQINYHRRLIAA